MKYLFHNFLNTLKRYKVSSLLNIVGMAVAFAAFYLILTQVSWNFNFNKNIKDADRTYLLSIRNEYSGDGFSPYMCRPIGEEIVSTGKGVEVGGIINAMTMENNIFLYKKEGSETIKIPFSSGAEVSEGGCEAIGLEVVSGSMDKLREPGSLGISETLAEKYNLELGDILSWDMSESGTVSRVVLVFSDIPENTSFSGVSVIRHIGKRDEGVYSNWGHNFYIKLEKGSDVDSILENARNVMLQYNNEKPNEFKMTSLEDIFYDNNIGYVRMTRTGNRTTDISLLVVAILTLLIALINFINFFFALVPVRIKSVNTYKVFGMSRGSLVLNFILESVGMALISLVISAVIVRLAVNSPFAAVFRSPCGFADNPGVTVQTILAAILSTAIGSIYPALYITSFQPAMVLKGFSAATTGSSLRTILIGLQFTVSISLILCSAFVKIQHDFMVDHDLGFDKEQLVCGSFNGEPTASILSYYGRSNEAFNDILRSDPRIRDVAWADGKFISADRMGWGRKYKEEEIYFQCYAVSWNFLDLMGIEMVRGRNFQKSDEQSEGGAIIFNEEADRRFAIDFDVPFYGHSDSDCEIAGICKDFYFRPLQFENDAFAFYVYGNAPWRDRLPNIFVRTEAGANPFDVIEFIREKVAELDPTYDIDLLKLSTIDQSLELQYKEEQNLSMLMTLFTLIAIIISLMGVFGIVLFDTQHKSKEIAIRRVLGAEVKDILRMLNRKYVITILICFLIAAPLSCVLIVRYLSGFANRTPIHWWVFAVTLLAVTVTTVMIVTARSLKAACSNPIEHIKEE